MDFDATAIESAAGIVLAVISKLAPLSIVLTALGLLNTLRESKAKRKSDRVRHLREAFNTLGVRIDVLGWSLMGDHAGSAAVLHVRADRGSTWENRFNRRRSQLSQ